MESTESIDNKKKNNIEKVKKLIPEFRTRLGQFKDKLQNPKFLDIKSDLREMQDEMKKVEAECGQFIKESKKYQEYQTTLEIEVDQFVDVDEVKREVNDRISLWNALNDWSSMVEEWKRAPFLHIDVDTISKEAEKYTKIVVRCERGLPSDSSAVKSLRDQVFEFKATMPIVVAIGNKNLRADHWGAIKDISNIDLELEEKDFCLGELIERNIAVYQEEIQDISIRATQEAKLETELTIILDKWNELNFVVKEYKEQYFVISELEELQVELDDMMTDLNNILGNRYVAKLKKQATELFDSLSLFVDLFDQWKDCQRNWLYLENIFESEDIRKNTGSDATEFDKVNKKLFDLMKNVNKDNKVKKYAKEQYLRELSKMNVTMDIIQKNLESFLETKRRSFPRFFFLSNDELLQILAAAQDIKKYEKHLNKIFENIVKLECGEGTQSTHIQKFISAEKEEVMFSPSVKPKSGDNIETTLSEIEDRMYETIKKLINHAHSNYNYENPERAKWVLNQIGQVTTTVSQVIWTEITENYIDAMQETRYTALDQLLEMIVTQLEELTMLIRGKLDPVKRKILISLITADVHNRDIIMELSRKGVDSIENFEWQKQLRYYISPGESCVVKQVNAELNYGYEYMGAASRLVITPLTDRCWMTITGALHINLGAAPAGPAGTGKTESTKDLAKALGIQ